ncbi:hypothetical protein B0G77_7975 [Paraburkholderia sp. BL10I2N1]|nr:hypothetical protein B0G77_7975 [Paraburkholderia sp. BL10I2N1]
MSYQGERLVHPRTRLMRRQYPRNPIWQRKRVAMWANSSASALLFAYDL